MKLGWLPVNKLRARRCSANACCSETELRFTWRGDTNHKKSKNDKGFSMLLVLVLL